MLSSLNIRRKPMYQGIYANSHNETHNRRAQQQRCSDFHGECP